MTPSAKTWELHQFWVRDLVPDTSRNKQLASCIFQSRHFWGVCPPSPRQKGRTHEHTRGIAIVGPMRMCTCSSPSPSMPMHPTLCVRYGKDRGPGTGRDAGQRLAPGSFLGWDGEMFPCTTASPEEGHRLNRSECDHAQSTRLSPQSRNYTAKNSTS